MRNPAIIIEELNILYTRLFRLTAKDNQSAKSDQTPKDLKMPELKPPEGHCDERDEINSKIKILTQEYIDSIMHHKND